MTDPDQWTELPTCPNCGMTGSAHLSRPEGRAFDFSVDAIPEGFKGIRLDQDGRRAREDQLPWP
jgi:hypothetical protein